MLIRNESPYGIFLNLDESSDNAGSLPDGQDLEAVTDPIDTGDSIDTGETVEPSYFHSYEDNDGNKTDFKDAAELNTYMRQSGLRHSDYTRKTQTLAEERKAYEANKARQDAEYTTFLTSKQENDKTNEMLASLPPEVFERLKQGIKGQPKKAARDPEVDAMLKEYESDKKTRSEEAQRQADNQAREKAFGSLEKELDGFDKEAVMNMVKTLEEVPQEDQMRTFMEMLHYSDKGRTTPAEMEQRIASNLEKKAKATTPMGHTAKTPDTGATVYSGIKAARQAAIEES